MAGSRGTSAPPLDMRKPGKIENEVMLSSSSAGRLCQEVKEENKNQEAGRVTNHHHQEDKRVYRESNSSSSLFNTNLCTNRLTRDRTYRGSGAPEIGTGSWQHPAASSTSPRASQTLPSSSGSGTFAAEKPPYFDRRTPALDILPCGRPTARMCSGKF